MFLWCLVYCQVSGEPGIAGYNAVAVINSGGVDVRTHLFIDHRHVNVFICVLNFHSWSQPQNYLNSKIFPIYCKLG